MSDSVKRLFSVFKKPLELLLNPQLRHEQKKAIGAKRKYFKDMFDRINQSKAYQGFFSSMWYSAMPCFDVKGVTSEKNGEYSVLKYCQWKGKPVSCSAIFTTFPTDRGMCCAFNMKSAEEIFRDTMYSNLVTELQVGLRNPVGYEI